MTLTFVFPPQINHLDYHLLMDGGYSDLVPAMTMRKLGIKYLVAINIGDERLMKTFNIGYHVSGLRCLLQALMPHLIDPIPNHFDFWDAILFVINPKFSKLSSFNFHTISIISHKILFSVFRQKLYPNFKGHGRVLHLHTP